MRRSIATMVSVVAVAAVLSPALFDHDSYPLSTYPMFSFDEGRIAAIDTAVGYDANGTRHLLSPTIIAGGIEVIHAAATLSASIDNGDTDALCAEIAMRARSRSSLVRIEVITEVHDVVVYFDHRDAPRDIVVHSTCDVPR